MESLDVFRKIVSSCSSNSSWLDMVRDDLTAVGKSVVADSPFPALLGNLPVWLAHDHSRTVNDGTVLISSEFHARAAIG